MNVLLLAGDYEPDISAVGEINSLGGVSLKTAAATYRFTKDGWAMMLLYGLAQVVDE